jgi:SAM-dependent methyltransferase
MTNGATVILPEDGHAAGRDAYVHGYGSVEQRRLERRSARESAAFFLPHLRPGMRVLDCGCGPGSITVGLAEVVAPGEVVGIDLAPRQVERAREIAAQRGRSNVRFEAGTVYELPFPDASFDAAYAHTLLMHLREPLGALREIRRVLRPGGVLGVCDDDHGACLWEPSTPGIRRLHALWLRAIEHGGGDPYRARHQRRLLLEAGFARTEGHAGAVGGGCWADAEATRFFARFVVHQFREPALVDLIVGQGWASRAEMDAMVAEVRAWGDRPDAHFAVLACATVAWVDEAAPA